MLQIWQQYHLPLREWRPLVTCCCLPLLSKTLVSRFNVAVKNTRHGDISNKSNQGIICIPCLILSKGGDHSLQRTGLLTLIVPRDPTFGLLDIVSAILMTDNSIDVSRTMIV